MYQSQQPRNKCEQFLHELQNRADRCRTDLKTFESISTNLDVNSSEVDASRKKTQVVALVQVKFIY